MSLIFKITNGQFRIDGQTILNEINFEIKQGEQWAILGLNGSGKTSLLNIISAYQFPSSGEVELLGETFGKTYMPDLRKRIGLISNSLERFSDYYRNQKIEDVVLSGKYSSFGIYETVEAEDYIEVDELLQQFSIQNYKGKPFHQLSEGEKRRVLIARAMMSQPEVLILDEPCSGLDLQSREQFLQSLEYVIERGTHLIYVTHHLEEILPFMTHVLLLKEGKIVAKGTKEEMITAKWLSETMNVPVEVQYVNNRPYVTVK